MKKIDMKAKKKAQGSRLVVIIIVLTFVILALIVFGNIMLKLMRE